MKHNSKIGCAKLEKNELLDNFIVCQWLDCIHFVKHNNSDREINHCYSFTVQKKMVVTIYKLAKRKRLITWL